MTTIVTKNGSGAPLASDLVQGELAVDLTNKRLYTEDSGGTVIEVGTSPSTIDINAGTIDGTVIGGSSAAAGTFTTFTSTGIDDNATSTAITIDSSENVGIGITAPTEKLTVRGDVTLTPDSTSAADRLAALTIGKRDSGTTGYMGQIDFVGSGTNGFATDIVFSSKTGDFFSSTTNEHMRIDSSGNVGIGTDSPGANLELKDTQPILRFQSSANAGYGQISASSGTLYYSADSGNTQASSAHVFSVDGDQKAIIDASGNVGIGTSSPTTKLQLGASEDAISWKSGNGIIECPTNLFLRSTSGGNVLLNVGGGNVGIGESAPNTLLHVRGTAGNKLKLENRAVGGTNTITFTAGNNGSVDNDIEYGSLDVVSSATGGGAESGYMAFSTRNSGTTAERMRIDSSGNVGIGRNSPDELLHLYGADPVLIIQDSDTSTTTANAEIRLAESTVGNAVDNYGYMSSNGLELYFGTSLGNERMRIDSSGNLLVGTTSQTAGGKLEVNGTAVFSIGVASNDMYLTSTLSAPSLQTSASGRIIAGASDRALKKDIEESTYGLKETLSLRPVIYKYKDEDRIGGRKEIGFIAQEVAPILPELGGGMEGNMWVDYAHFIPVLTKAIQEQQAMIEELKAEVAALKGA